MQTDFYGSVKPLLLAPKEKFADFQSPPKTLRRCKQSDHYTEWTTACKTGGETVCPLDFGCQMAELALLGSLALRTGCRWNGTPRRCELQAIQTRTATSTRPTVRDGVRNLEFTY